MSAQARWNGPCDKGDAVLARGVDVRVRCKGADAGGQGAVGGVGGGDDPAWDNGGWRTRGHARDQGGVSGQGICM